ncbi:MAG: hypothetical protein KKB22_05015 [Candidatus Omnitrophica bacterium]|nr:hypothetical protein [Candidatus Omnitrophota bacterium]
MGYEISILHYVDLYKKNSRILALVIGIAVFMAMLVTIIKPSAYITTVTILSYRGENSISSLSKFLGVSSASSANSFNEVVISILQSRRMSKDIRAKFELDKKPGFFYSIKTRPIIAGLAIDVRGSDPMLIEKIAIFAIDNLDNINSSLDITPNKPMVKVLDAATPGSKESKKTVKKMMMSGLLAFLLTSAYLIFSDYFKKIKI